jgi:hypothetical protein
VLGGYLDGGAELQAALRFVANRADPRRVAWLEAALRVEWLVDVAHAPDVGNASAQARALELAHVLVEALDWRGAALCARLVDVLQRGVANQSVTRFSQVRLAAGALIGAIVCATRGAPASAAMRALVDALIVGAPTRPETLELLLQVALFDTAITDVLGEALPRVVPLALDGQRATDRDRASMASLASVSLMQDTLAPAQLDALVAAFDALVQLDVDVGRRERVAVAAARAADAAAGGVSPPLRERDSDGERAGDWPARARRPARRGARGGRAADCVGAARAGGVGRFGEAARSSTRRWRVRRAPTSSTAACSAWRQ